MEVKSHPCGIDVDNILSDNTGIKVNILCMKWGTAYGPEYVNRLYNMVSRNLTLPFNFICFTDDKIDLNSNIITMPIPDITVPKKYAYSPWKKLSIFKRDLGQGKFTGKAIFLDLDIVIIDNIDCFFNYKNDFCIIENWSQLGEGIGNSSVYFFNIGSRAEIFDKYENNPEIICKNFDNEQIYLSREIGNQINFWPKEWCRSFKRHCIPKGIKAWFNTPTIPQNVKIIVFHGHPKPHEAAEGKWPSRIFKHVCKTPWIYNYWK